ncbi:hypothetical protein [Escherichia phage vB_EcoM_ULIM9]|nr:hypothetical protein [Escherichia phage vB_EcoM_ULIM9]
MATISRYLPLIRLWHGTEELNPFEMVLEAVAHALES